MTQTTCTVCNAEQEKNKDDFQKCVNCGTYFITSKELIDEKQEIDKIVFESYEQYEKEFFPKLHKQKQKQKKSIQGLKFCTTGKLQSMTRSEFQVKLQYYNAFYRQTPTYDTDYLVTNYRTPTAKFIQARDRNITIISEYEFINMVKGN